MLEPRPSLRVYDSRSTRELEAFLALQGDLNAMAGWIEGLSPFMEAFGGGPEYDERALPLRTVWAYWNSTVIALLRHYKGSPGGLVSRVYDEVLADLGQDFVDWFAHLERERDRKIAHPIGHSEGYIVTVDLDESPPFVDTYSFTLVGPSGNDADYLFPFWGKLRAATLERVAALLEQVRREVAVLSGEVLERLPPAYVRAPGRRFGA